MAIELVPLCSIDATLSPPTMVGSGPSGMRLIFEVESMKLSGERINGVMHGHAAADWLTVTGSVGTVDVRGTVQTDDGALVFVQYQGRTDISAGGRAPIYVAPRFETGDPRYEWLNLVQAVGKGSTTGNTIHYDWFEVR